jgi:hypothetical protein
MWCDDSIFDTFWGFVSVGDLGDLWLALVGFSTRDFKALEAFVPFVGVSVRAM